MKTAVISVSDKTGLVEFATGLKKLDYQILSTGGTAKLLKENSIGVTEISDYTESKEMMDGRVKSLHPKIFGGILALRNNGQHMKELKENDLNEIDMVVVNLYPFEQTIGKGASFEDAIENIDIGGPSLLRAAAKNHMSVLPVVDPDDYSAILEDLQKNDGTASDELKKKLALKTFEHTARYDTIINQYFVDAFEVEEFPKTLNLSFNKVEDLRYGENPHQKAAFYKDPFVYESSLGTINQLHGKQLSYNNILDVDNAFELVKDFSEPAAVVVKHNNPSGVAVADKQEDAFRKAFDADPLSAFGGVIALNKPCNKETASLITENFAEIVVCPSFEKDALDILQKKKNLRLLETGKITKANKGYELKKVVGGLLAQTREFPEVTKEMCKVVTKRKPTDQELNDLLFAYKINKHVKSNAIVFAKDNMTVGIGAGQMSRVDSVMIATSKSKGRSKGAVMASDAFFPFRDGIDEAAKAGITAIIHPGGSIRDEEVIKAADEHGMAMVTTGVRLFRH